MISQRINLAFLDYEISSRRNLILRRSYSDILNQLMDMKTVLGDDGSLL
jgi:hypothetical protein